MTRSAARRCLSLEGSRKWVVGSVRLSKLRLPTAHCPLPTSQSFPANPALARSNKSDQMQRVFRRDFGLDSLERFFQFQIRFIEQLVSGFERRHIRRLESGAP